MDFTLPADVLPDHRKQRRSPPHFPPDHPGLT